jgi:hypothetical protein
MSSESYLIKNAPQLDVYKWSEFPEVDNVVSAIFEEIKALRASRGKRVRKADKVKKHLKVILIALWAATKLGTNPYRSISKNKSDFQRGTRYRKIYLKYDYFVGVINDLVELKYIKEKLGARFEGTSFRTRIKAEDKLINKILFPEYGLNTVVTSKGNIGFISRTLEVEPETIILRNSDAVNVDYDDTAVTIQMRENLKKVNLKLSEARISLEITDSQHEELIERLRSEKNPRPTVDFTNNKMHRVFNHSSFENGGRFYGGWWEHIPKDYRKYIHINHKLTAELDYSGHHVRILYAMEGIEPPDEPYDLTGFDREDQKNALLIILNAYTEKSALHAIRKEGIRNGRALLAALKERHSQIQHYFTSGIGNHLMYKDSVLAEKVMLRMLELDATVLPVHDSFIVRNSYAEELEQVMKEEFESMFGRDAKLKYKKTVLDEPTTTDPWNYYQDKTWMLSVWGY